MIGKRFRVPMIAPVPREGLEWECGAGFAPNPRLSLQL